MKGEILSNGTNMSRISFTILFIFIAICYTFSLKLLITDIRGFSFTCSTLINLVFLLAWSVPLLLAVRKIDKEIRCLIKSDK